MVGISAALQIAAWRVPVYSPEQDEAGHVPANRALGALIAHNLPRPPCRPDQPRRLRSREPALSCDPLLGKYHRHNLRAQAFLAMMVDGGAKVLQFPACGCLGHQPRPISRLVRFGRSPRLTDTPCNIIAAALAVYVRKRVGLPKVGERQDTLLRLLWPGVLPRLVGEVDVQDVEDEDVSWMTVPIARGSVFAGKVPGKRPLSPRAVLSSAARADLTRSVADDPGRVTDEFTARVALL
jgi:hypothetical protein